MADAPARFEWHPQAKLSWRGREVPRPTGMAPAMTPLTVRLAHALNCGGPFLLSDDPELLQVTEGAAHGTFFTLTGGTTGAPKVIRRSCASWIASFEVNARLFDCEVIDQVAVLGDLSHSLAQYGTVEALHLGLDVHVLEGMPAPAQWRQLMNLNVSIIYGTPSQLHLLSKAGRGGQNEMVRLILCGGGPLSDATLAMVEEAFPAALVRAFYGAAETSFISMTRYDTPPGSVGPAYPGATIEIRNADGTKTDGAGEVWVKSPYLSDGYANGAEGGKRDGAGFASAGEIGWLDDEGNLFLEGRADRRFTVADHSLQPEYLETALNALSEVKGSAVLPVSDGARGHRPVVIVEAAEDTELLPRIRDCCVRALGQWAVPKDIHFIEKLPRLTSGKLDLKTLARQFGEDG
ncbi:MULTISPECIES: AMP-binding protein [unclassified Sulfitobacter]|uniref:AMP-binding protein n=1 Tax=unclassified Sulfitobacter TaxID=196795 RepID=UPI0007C3E9EE|nr:MULTISPECIES: AMP-binding protein [unclassified Sulfitobacter]KZX94149.1 hypothetical protein A3721_10450 [Sulfitobacter sp. HI0023]KZY23501.1 hypothetical protein A3728_08575 [Sulfitobacter sp. HI0040]KZZ71459.1 hypothetical protein A3764_06830 [Sulfitobacter sp. HI0129]